MHFDGDSVKLDNDFLRSLWLESEKVLLENTDKNYKREMWCLQGHSRNIYLENVKKTILE